MNDELRDLAALYALGALPDEERAAAEAAFEDDPEFRAEVDRHLQTAESLDSVLAAEPPPELRSSIMGEVARTDQIGGSAVVDISRARNRRLGPLLAAAAVVLAVLVGAAVLVAGSDDRDVYATVAGRADAQELVLTGEVDGTVGVAWSQSDATFALRGVDVPPLAEGEIYALWFIDADAPRPSGLFSPTNGVVQISGALPGVPSGWAITIEPAGGSPTPTGEILYSSAV